MLTASADNPRASGITYLSLALLGLVSVLPFLYPLHYFPQPSFYGEWTAFVLGIGACIAFLTRAFWLKLGVPKVTVYVLALLLVIAVQGLWISRPYVAQSLLPGLYLCWAMLVIVLAGWLRTSLGPGKTITALSWFVLIGSLLHAVTGVVQYLGIAGWLASFVVVKLGAAIYGNVAQENQFATHLTLGVAALIYLYSQHRLSTVFSFCLLGFFALMTALSGSKAVLVYSLALAALSFVTYKKRPDASNVRLVACSLFFLVAYIGAQYLAIWMSPWLKEQLADLSLNINPFAHNVALERLPSATFGIEERVSEWRKAWRMFLEAPLFGIGIGNYAWHSFQYQSLPEFSNVPKSNLFSHSHNLFIQVLAETGIVGLGILLGLIISWIRQFFKESLFAQHGWFIAAVLLVLFLHSSVEYPLWYSYFLGIASVMMGLGDSRTIRLTFTPWLGQTGAALSLCLVCFLLAFTLMGFRTLANASNTFSKTDAQETINSVLRIANNPFLEPYAEITLTALMPLSKDSIEDKLTIVTRAYKRNPTALVAYRRATLLALSGQDQEARVLLEQCALMYPNTLPRYIEMLEILPDEETKVLREYAERLYADRPD